eukprot:m.952723 g.952723  ORF g.952723 m.952723 type:complete len:222 (+) comp23868_c2_seq34:150-815(+)
MGRQIQRQGVCIYGCSIMVHSFRWHLVMLQIMAVKHVVAYQYQPCNSVRAGPDPCLPHAKTDILSGKCGDAGSQNPDVNTSCYTCYTGDTCDDLIQDCDVIVECGWPLMFSEVWGKYPCPNGEPETKIPSDFGLAYQFFESPTTLLKGLESTIRELHHVIGNVNTDEYHILPGYGGTGASISIMAAIVRLCFSFWSFYNAVCWRCGQARMSTLIERDVLMS